MKKIVYNNRFGGFGLSNIGLNEYAKLKGINLTFYKQGNISCKDCKKEWTKLIDLKDNESSFIHAFTKDFGQTFDGNYNNNDYYYPNIKRDDPDLVTVVEKLGDKANGPFASLAITEVNGQWRIDEYDGLESVETPSSYDWND